jgi:hypothetical protein
MNLNRDKETKPNADVKKDDENHIPVDERDFDDPGIAPTKPSSMPRAEDDPKTWQRSPEYHDRE